jgi:hypothetical protein
MKINYYRFFLQTALIFLLPLYCFANELVYWGDGPYRHMRDPATFRQLTGLELSGLSSAPGFSDPASGDYTLSSGSPLIDRGLIIPGINDDYTRAAPDITDYK